MNTDIRIAVSFKGHRKRKKLVKIIGHEGVGCLIDLWLGAAMSNPSGMLSAWDEHDIALEAGWDGEPEEFVKALIDCRFLEKMECGTYKLHDWEDHQGYVIHSKERIERAKSAAQARWSKKTPQQNQEDDAASMPLACEEHTECNAPSPAPAPAPAPAPTPTPLVKNTAKKKFGEFNNVLLTDEEMEKLKGRFNGTLAEKIESLSAYIASKGEKYKSHYATIIAWDKKDKVKAGTSAVRASGPIFADGIQRKIL